MLYGNDRRLAKQPAYPQIGEMLNWLDLTLRMLLLSAQEEMNAYVRTHYQETRRTW